MTDLFDSLNALYPTLAKDVELWDIDSAMEKLKDLTPVEEVVTPAQKPKMSIAAIKQTLLDGGKKLYNGTVKVDIQHEGGREFKSKRIEYVAYVTTPRFNTVYKTPDTVSPKGFPGFVDDLAYWLADKMN